IVLGDGAGHFMPNDPVTGAQLELMLSRFAALKGLDYVPTNKDSAPVTRAKLAQMLSGVYALLKGENALMATQQLVLEGCDWGPAVAQVVLHLSKPIDPASVSAESFAVTELKESFNWFTFSPAASVAARAVTAAYASDAAGQKVEGSAEYVTLSLAFDPDTGSPYYYDFVGTGQNRYASPYNQLISLTASSTLATADGRKVDALAVGEADVTASLMPQLTNVQLDGTFTGKDGKTLTYAAYAPAEDGAKHPLVIWLHGMGEGGTDPTVALLGNKVTALLGEEFQSVMGGAYVLTPQTSLFWLLWNEEDPSSWGANPGTRSVYTDTLMELIEAYVAENPGIDTNRIYIGGCSNGGYMTMNMILEYPTYFAAAYPICEAYMDSGITETQLEAIQELPVWFVYSRDDTTVLPETYEAPTIARLRAMGANVKTSIFDHVVDTSGLYTDAEGKPYQYMGHWSWLYFFNNKCVDDTTGENLWSWLAAQHK
ncbi:MAG: prolyl oligopeptidase family serine peptidase, partial [bacterium]